MSIIRWNLPLGVSVEVKFGCKISITSFDFEMNYLGVFKYEKNYFDYQNFLVLYNGSAHWFGINVILSPSAWNFIFGGFQVSKSQFPL